MHMKKESLFESNLFLLQKRFKVSALLKVLVLSFFNNLLHIFYNFGRTNKFCGSNAAKEKRKNIWCC